MNPLPLQRCNLRSVQHRNDRWFSNAIHRYYPWSWQVYLQLSYTHYSWLQNQSYRKGQRKLEQSYIQYAHRGRCDRYNLSIRKSFGLMSNLYNDKSFPRSSTTTNTDRIHCRSKKNDPLYCKSIPSPKNYYHNKDTVLHGNVSTLMMNTAKHMQRKFQRKSHPYHWSHTGYHLLLLFRQKLS